MPLSDRDYYRDSDGSGSGWGGGGDVFSRIMRWLNASFPIGTYLGIRVRVHITFFLLLIFRLFHEGDPVFTVRWTALLFISVLLHEFGHCLACRRVGGVANDVLMWPLGGLAMCHPPRRPWAEFVTVVWGPLVNVILGALSLGVLLIMTGPTELPVSLNPLRPWTGYYAAAGPVGNLIADLFVVNYILLLFNIALVFYPFDGGRLVQIAMWTKLGYGKSLRLATSIGMVGAILVAIFGLTVRNMLLVLIAAFGFVTCFQQQRYLREVGVAGGEFDYDYGAVDERPQRGPGRLKQWKDDRAEKRARDHQAEVDRILDKVHREGLNSLSAKEKRVLRDATNDGG